MILLRVTKPYGHTVERDQKKGYVVDKDGNKIDLEDKLRELPFMKSLNKKLKNKKNNNISEKDKKEIIKNKKDKLVKSIEGNKIGIDITKSNLDDLVITKHQEWLISFLKIKKYKST